MHNKKRFVFVLSCDAMKCLSPPLSSSAGFFLFFFKRGDGWKNKWTLFWEQSLAGRPNWTELLKNCAVLFAKIPSVTVGVIIRR